MTKHDTIKPQGRRRETVGSNAGYATYAVIETDESGRETCHGYEVYGPGGEFIAPTQPTRPAALSQMNAAVAAAEVARMALQEDPAEEDDEQQRPRMGM